MPSGVEIAERQEAERTARAERWQLQSEAARLLRRKGDELQGERVCSCMRRIRSDQDGVYVLISPQGATHYGGLQTCGSVWMCPICAAKITERRRVELHGAVAAARVSHLRVVLLTYTFSHQAHQRLPGLLLALLRATRRMKSGRAAQELHRRYGVVGSVRALEVTHGVEHGWHPHIHELVFLPAEVDAEAFAGEVRQAWMEAAGACGLGMNEHGFDWSDTDGRVGEYVAKYGHEPRWQESDELTKWHIKRGQGEHMTPFGLLRAAAAGDGEAGRLFVEYAKAFKGKRQLYWSPALRELLGLGEDLSDEEVAAQREEPAVVLGMLTVEEWRVVVANDVRCELLEVARSGEWSDVWGFLALVGARGEW